MRLYAEFMNQKQKLEDDKRRIEELYQEKLERERTSISKVPQHPESLVTGTLLAVNFFQKLDACCMVSIDS